MTEIVIVGCGISGMLTALAYAKKNVKTTIIERSSVEPPEFCNDIRTTALTPSSREFLDNIDIWSELNRSAAEMLNVYVVDNKAPQTLHLTNESPNKTLGYIVQNREFKKILVSRVKNDPLITLIDKCSYKKLDSYANYSVIYLDNNKEIRADLVIICEGSRSKIKQHYFSNKAAKSYHQTAITFHIKHTKSHENCALEHFMPLGPFAILPLQDLCSSSVVWSTSEEQACLLMNLEKEELEYIIQKNAGRSLGKITVEGEIKAFPLKAQVTNKYFYNKIILVADSAHTIHPLAGQGLNQGIKDIETLVKLTNNVQVTSAALENYQKLRADDNYFMYMITDILNTSFSNSSEYLWYFRRIGLKTIDNFSLIKNLLTAYAMGKR